MKKVIFFSLFLFGFCTASTSVAALKIGDLAPDFTLIDQDGNKVSLRNFQGKKVALYFYPRSFTSHCTKQACSLRDSMDQLKKKGITVIGITYDKPDKLKQFISQYKLPFSVLSDIDAEVAKAYGTYKGLFKWVAPKRFTFLIDEHGKIVDIIKKVKVTRHAQQILDRFNKTS